MCGTSCSNQRNALQGPPARRNARRRPPFFSSGHPAAPAAVLAGVQVGTAENWISSLTFTVLLTS